MLMCILSYSKKEVLVELCTAEDVETARLWERLRAKRRCGQRLATAVVCIGNTSCHTWLAKLPVPAQKGLADGCLHS